MNRMGYIAILAGFGFTWLQITENREMAVIAFFIFFFAAAYQLIRWGKE